MDSDMMALERVGAVEKMDGLWNVTKTGRDMLNLLATLVGHRPEDKDDGVNFDYAVWKEKNNAFDHAAYDAKWKAVDIAARGDNVMATDFHKWMAAHDQIMKGVERPPFKPNAMYNKHGDGLQVYLCTDDNYTQWLCPGVEVMRAFSDNRIVGFNVWGLSHVVASGGGELRRLPDEDKFLAAKASRPPGMDCPRDDGPVVPPRPVV